MFRQLFRPASVILVRMLSLTNIPTKIACNSDLAPSWLFEAANKFSACPPAPLVMIPYLLTSAELKGVVAPVSRRLPDTKAMSDNRLGKLAETFLKEYMG